MTGVLVVNMDAGGAAAQGDLQVNDVIVSINDATIDKVSDLPTHVTGMVFRMKIRRAQQEKALTLLD